MLTLHPSFLLFCLQALHQNLENLKPKMRGSKVDRKGREAPVTSTVTVLNRNDSNPPESYRNARSSIPPSFRLPVRPLLPKNSKPKYQPQVEPQTHVPRVCGAGFKDLGFRVLGFGKGLGFGFWVLGFRLGRFLVVLNLATEGSLVNLAFGRRV